jgi:hypothetical protein
MAFRKMEDLRWRSLAITAVTLTVLLGGASADTDLSGYFHPVPVRCRPCMQLTPAYVPKHTQIFLFLCTNRASHLFNVRSLASVLLAFLQLTTCVPARPCLSLHASMQGATPYPAGVHGGARLVTNDTTNTTTVYTRLTFPTAPGFDGPGGFFHVSNAATDSCL